MRSMRREAWSTWREWVHEREKSGKVTMCVWERECTGKKERERERGGVDK